MNEAFLHYVWKFRMYGNSPLLTQMQETIEVLKPGEHNTHAGPDFFNARIKIGNTEWAGNVEVHLKSSDWKKHTHHLDKAYDNIILHVVFEDDEPVFRKSGKIIPVLVLKNYLDPGFWERYQDLMKSASWIPCEKHIPGMNPFLIESWLQRLLVERLEVKSELISEALKINSNNWEETFYQQLARNFGFRINAIPFEMLARSLPLQTLARHKDNLHLTEALLYGQSGMLCDHFNDDYARSLKKEYSYLQKKFGLTPLEKHLWKYLRLQPVNFPCIRISQFANLINQSSHLFSIVMECSDYESILQLFDVSASAYWDSHFLFDKETPVKKKKIGRASVENILINTVVPFLFVFGQKKNEPMYKERAINFLENIPAEKNSIILKWNETGIRADTAFTSQALHQLRNDYCIQKKCLNCTIGKKVLDFSS